MDLSIYPRPSVSHRLVNILQIPVIWWMLQHWAMSLSPKEDKIIPFQFSNWKVVLLRVWLECHQDWWNIMTCCLTISLSVVLEREKERERERMNLNFECLPPSGDPAYWVWVHENLDLWNQSLHQDLECSSQLGRQDLHPILQPQQSSQLPEHNKTNMAKE